MNRDGRPSVGERGIPDAVVAFDAETFVTTDASGQFDLPAPDDQPGIVWVRVPDGFVPGPVWAPWSGKPGADVDLGLRRLPAPFHEPLTFVVAADTHLSLAQTYNGAVDLATAAFEATALDPPPAFFTILGDITQGNKDQEFDLVDVALSELGVPWVPVPGNHDWYDGGATWFRRYGPDNYSFDIANTHFVVWNMALDDAAIRAYLGAELSRVPKAMTIVALTHAPPSPIVLRALRDLGVDYVLTGHAHSNRVVDHDGVIELNTEPLLMGGLDFTPAGYRVMTLSGGKLTSYHRTTVDVPFVSIVGPGHGQCVAAGSELVVAAELDASPTVVTAQIDCATPIALRYAGGLDWRATLPALASGPHDISVTARSASGAHGETHQTIHAGCASPPASAGAAWPQLGGGATHEGAVARAIAPPLAARWTQAIGGSLLSAPPAIVNGSVFVTVTDLGDGRSGGVVALELATGAVKWRATTEVAVRGGVAVVGNTVVVPRIDGIVLGLDTATGEERWRHELAAHVAPQAAATFASVAAIDNEVVIGHQRAVAAIDATTGSARWHHDPVPEGADSQSLAAVAIAGNTALGTFNRALGGVLAWDRATGAPLWQLEGDETIAINATPVIANGLVYIVNAADTVSALELGTGTIAWSVQLDELGFEWGNATIGTPAVAHGIVVVPTLYRDLVALDAKTGSELWRHEALPSPLRLTHYRGANEAGYEASPVITGDIVWIADTSGELAALDLATGAPLWRTSIGAPVLSGLATSGDWLVVASYDGTVRGFAPAPERPWTKPARCDAPPPPSGGCCDVGAPGSGIIVAGVAILLLRRRR